MFILIAGIMAGTVVSSASVNVNVTIQSHGIIVRSIDRKGAITWASTTSLPGPRAQHASVTYNGRIYVLGGWESAGDNTVYYCNVNPDGTIDSWHSTTFLPERRSETVAVAYDGYIYLLGGQGPQPPYRIERDTVWYAPINPDGTLGNWGTTTSLPESQSGHGAFVWNGRIYVVGGWTGFSFRRETYFAEVHPDGTLGSWVATSLLPEARGHTIAAVVHNGYAYALGGQGPDLTYKADVWYAKINQDGTLGPWVTTESMPMGLHGHGVAIVDNEIYVIGGGTHAAARAEVYRASINPDGTLGDWGRDTDLALPIGIEPRAHLVQTPMWNNRIYVIGGDDETGTVTNTVYYTQTTGPQDLDPWKYCPYVYMGYGYGFPWDTTPDLPVNVLYTGTYFWGDLRVIQYWFHWNVDYKWWPSGFLKSAIDYTKGEGWVNPLRQPEKQHDWEPIIVIVDDEGSLDSVLWRWHYNWFKYSPGVFSPTYQGTHIKLWWSVASHTPLNKYLAVDVPILLQIASLLKTPNQFKTVIGQYGDLAKPPLYSLSELGVTYPCEMEEWDEDLALSMGFSISDLRYVNNPTFAYAELTNLGRLLRVVTESPIDILVTAPDGLRVGYDWVTQGVINEIEGATYSGPGTEPQTITIPSPLLGTYKIDVVGTDYGVYAITILSLTEDSLVTGIETYGGETVKGPFMPILLLLLMESRLPVRIR